MRRHGFANVGRPMDLRELEDALVWCYQQPREADETVVCAFRNQQIKIKDTKCLQPMHFVGDNIMDYAAQILSLQLKGDDSLALADTNLYRALATAGYDFDRVRFFVPSIGSKKELRGGQLLHWGSCKKLLLFVHQPLHYILVRICFETNVIQLYCSLNSYYEDVMRNLVRYCVDIADFFNGEKTTPKKWRCIHERCPQQLKNGNDCGLHTVANFISLIHGKPLITIPNYEVSAQFRATLFRCFVNQSMKELVDTYFVN